MGEAPVIAFLYPGQGSQAPGMGQALSRAFPEAQEVFAVADEALDVSVSQLCFGGDEQELRLTANTQPALLTASVAAHRTLETRGLRPAWVAGHSLGEYSALVGAGALELTAALRLVRNRGRYMQEAVAREEGAMAAILGLSDDEVEALCTSQSGNGVVEVANRNCPGQVVVAGSAAAVDALIERAKEAGAKRAMRLNVSAPFHCSLMAPAAERLAPELDNTPFSDPVVPLVCNVDAAPVNDAEAARDALKRQVTRTVRWTESVLFLQDAGVNVFVEVGPGRVLGGLVRRTVGRSVAVHGVAEPDDVDGLEAALDSREKVG